MMPPYDVTVPAPFLQGQTQADADESGVMRNDDMILSAIPGEYALAVTLPDYPQVMGSPKWIAMASPTLYGHADTCPIGGSHHDKHFFCQTSHIGLSCLHYPQLTMFNVISKIRTLDMQLNVD